MRPLLRLLLLAALLGSALPACEDGDGGTPPPVPGGVVLLRLVHEADGDTLRVGDGGLTNAAGNTWSVDRLDYYLGRLRLHRPGGVLWNLPLARSAHFVSLADSSTWTWRIEGVPPGTYESLTVGFGLPEELNTDSALGEDPPHDRMAWPEPLGGGYHNLKLEGSFEGGAYALHGGVLRQGGQVHGGEAPNELEHRDYELGADPVLLTLVVDLDELFDAPNRIDLGVWFPGAVTSNPVAQTWLQENCGGLLSVRSVRTLVEEDRATGPAVDPGGDAGP